MRIWIDEICSTLPFRVSWQEPDGGQRYSKHFATELEATGFARGFCEGFAMVKAHLPDTPHFAGGINRRSRFLPVASGYGHTPAEAHELNRPKVGG
jgi:hypothetical protein